MGYLIHLSGNYSVGILGIYRAYHYKEFYCYEIIESVGLREDVSVMGSNCFYCSLN